MRCFLKQFLLEGRNEMSEKNFHTLIIENDPFASNMMMILLAKDYRTHVAGELSSRFNLEILDALTNPREAKKAAEFDHFNIDPKQPIDVVILGTEVPWDNDLPIKILEKFSKWAVPPKVLCTCTYPDAKMLQKISAYKCFSGYLVKSDVLYCIASAVCLAAKNYTVVSSQVCSLLEKEAFQKFRAETLILNSPNDGEKLRTNAKLGMDIIRLKLIFNLPQSEIRDELFTTEEYVAQVISKKYSNLHMPNIVFGTITLDELFTNPYIDNKKIIEHYQKILDELPEIMAKRSDSKRNPKFRNMDTLAFHLMTRPNIEKW
jgi:hypothetical protein